MKYPALTFLILLLFVASCSPFKAGRMKAPSDGPRQIPFEMQSEVVIVEATVNGKPGRFLFDNGFSLNALDDDFVKDLEVDWKGRLSPTDGNNRRISLRRGEVGEIELGGFRFINTGFYQIDTDRFFPCDPIDGVIGAPVINRANWKLDFSDSTMQISKRPFREEGFVMDIDINAFNISFVDLEVNGKAARTQIDLGYGGELKLHSDWFGPLFKGKEALKRIGITSLSVTGAGQVDTSYRIDEGVSVTQDDRPLPIQPELELSLHLKYDARMGTEYLSMYELIVNSSRKEYILDPLPGKNKQPEHPYGIAVYPLEDTFRIVQIFPAEPYTEGIELMDELFFIDGKPVGYFADFCALRDYVREKRKRKEDLLIRIRGKEAVFRIPYKEPEKTVVE